MYVPREDGMLERKDANDVPDKGRGLTDGRGL
jgi:hypothetical protein